MNFYFQILQFIFKFSCNDYSLNPILYPQNQLSRMFQLHKVHFPILMNDFLKIQAFWLNCRYHKLVFVSLHVWHNLWYCALWEICKGWLDNFCRQFQLHNWSWPLKWINLTINSCAYVAYPDIYCSLLEALICARFDCFQQLIELGVECDCECGVDYPAVYLTAEIDLADIRGLKHCVVTAVRRVMRCHVVQRTTRRKCDWLFKAVITDQVSIKLQFYLFMSSILLHMSINYIPGRIIY